MTMTQQSKLIMWRYGGIRTSAIVPSCPSYDSKIHVRSTGYIFGEMLSRKPMFPWNDYIHLLTLMDIDALRGGVAPKATSTVTSGLLYSRSAMHWAVQNSA